MLFCNFYNLDNTMDNKVRRMLCAVFAGMMLVLCLAAAPAGLVRAADASMLPMYRRAVDLPQGDLSRLAQVIRRAQDGEEITIGFLGGSITEGRGAANIQDCYVSQVYKWWYDTFPQAKINVINAGLGGTSSYLGVHRVDEEILSHDPDLVFVEFAVNDTLDGACTNSYENLIRKILLSDSHPALVLLFATNETGDSAEEAEAELGRYYELPMISYGKAVLPEVEAGSFAWYEIAEDIVHPNNRGHAIFAGLITMYLEEICSRLDRIRIDEARLQPASRVRRPSRRAPRSAMACMISIIISWTTGMPWRRAPTYPLRWRHAASASCISGQRRGLSGSMTSISTVCVSGHWMGILSGVTARRQRRRHCTHHRMGSGRSM